MNLPVDKDSQEGKEFEEAKSFWNGFKMLTYCLLGTALLSFVGGIVAMSRRGIFATFLFWIGSIGSLYFAYTLHNSAIMKKAGPPPDGGGGLNIFTLILICVAAPLLAGLLSLLIRRPAEGATA
jgi:hypothetical protein